MNRRNVIKTGVLSLVYATIPSSLVFKEPYVIIPDPWPGEWRWGWIGDRVIFEGEDIAKITFADGDEQTYKIQECGTLRWVND